MKLIIAGSRTLEPSSPFLAEILDHFGIQTTEIVSGTARGVDQAGEIWAESVGKKVTSFPANWTKHGRGAGHIRNREMALYADALLLIWDGESRGSKNMKETMLSLGKPIYEVILREETRT